VTAAVAERAVPATARRPEGLTETEVARLLAARAPAPPPASSRSYGSIVRANVLTVFNVILLAFGILTLAFGEWQDALFLGVVVANSTIGIVQEVRAKRALDRLAALVAPTATVVRDGRPRSLGVGEVVVGDLVRVGAGDQIVADGELSETRGLALDEAILTGESEPVVRRAGDEVRSGSFAVEGSGSYVVTAVGPDSYAARIAGEARAFRHPRSPLERALNRLLFALVALMIPLGVLLGFALWERRAPLARAVPTAVAAVVTLIPEGLVLLASLTYAVAALRMTRRGALAQQLNAIESLASVDVVCLDKTGTLTEPRLRVVEVVPDDHGIASSLGRYAASASARNPTLEAIAAALPAEPQSPDEETPFSSRRRWSALRFGDELEVLGAPELFEVGRLAERAEEERRKGRRVLAFARGSAGVTPPEGARVRAIVVLAEELRPEARATVEYLAREGVAVVCAERARLARHRGANHRDDSPGRGRPLPDRSTGGWRAASHGRRLDARTRDGGSLRTRPRDAVRTRLLRARCSGRRDARHRPRRRRSRRGWAVRHRRPLPPAGDRRRLSSCPTQRDALERVAHRTQTSSPRPVRPPKREVHRGSVGSPIPRRQVRGIPRGRFPMTPRAPAAGRRVRVAALLLIAGLVAGPVSTHVYWMLGGTWGLPSSTSTGIRVVAAVVVVLLMAAVLVVLARVGLWQQAFVSDRVIRFFAWALAAIFLVETVASFTWGRAQEWWMYGPVSLVIAVLASVVAGSGGAWPRVLQPHRARPSH
jgi:P-type E1-E2 ATPase